VGNSFAGGRTVYDNLNKALFEPVPICGIGRSKGKIFQDL
jgi:hypothetical protein